MTRILPGKEVKKGFNKQQGRLNKQECHVNDANNVKKYMGEYVMKRLLLIMLALAGC